MPNPTPEAIMEAVRKQRCEYCLAKLGEVHMEDCPYRNPKEGD